MQIDRVEHGYCHGCGRPDVVGRVALAQWRHVIWICNLCLRRLADQVVNDAPKVQA